MPRGDKTGPDGKGPKTGRGVGFCSGGEQPGFKNAGDGRGMGRGRGFGRGLGRGFSTQPIELSKEEEIKILEAEKQAIEQKLKQLQAKK
jgi:hypothetical protein